LMRRLDLKYVKALKTFAKKECYMVSLTHLVFYLGILRT